ncbi:MAG: 3'-5' exonuclease [Hydrogenovibrio sp.]|nr:3'-5' exonuclease [Hydrogenovibrio sp.]
MIQTLYQKWQKSRLKRPEFAFLFDRDDDRERVCFDCETSGLNPKKDKILSLSAIKIVGDEILASQSLNLAFKQPIEIGEASIKVHQIRNLDMSQGLEPQAAIEQFLHFIGGRPLVGYYLAFDVEMVNQLIRPWLGISLPNPQIEVSRLYYDFKQSSVYLRRPENEIDLSFDAILKDLALPNLGQHDAFNDALMTALIYIKLNSLKKLKQK